MGTAYTQLSLKERRIIEDWWHAKVPVREMARVLKRHKSTIHREIKRNFWADDAFPKKYAGYFGHAAQLRTQKRRSVQKTDPASRALQGCRRPHQAGMDPEQIGNRMIFERARKRVCQETIYRCIYSKEGMSQELWWYLPEHRKARRPRRARKRQAPKFDRDVSILFRPDDVAHRRQFGHWEADLMLFKQDLGQSNITSLVERVSRFTMLLINPNKRTKPVMGKIMSAVRTCPIWPGNPSPSIAAPSSSAGRIFRPRSGRRPGSATPPHPGRKARSRTQTDVSADGCPASATSAG